MGLADDLATAVDNILNTTLTTRDGRVVPETEDVGNNEAVRLEANFLYADLSESSRLATDFQQRTAAKVIRAFLYCMSRLINHHSGEIRSFDGDRVMGVFIGDSKNSHSAKCALRMNYVVKQILKPKLEAHFKSLKQDGFTISHCVGIDRSTVLAVRAGMRGSNDLVWVGRAPNYAAKLSDLRNDPYRSYITADVFNRLNEEAKYAKNPKRLMWQECTVTLGGQSTKCYKSSFWWKP